MTRVKRRCELHGMSKSTEWLIWSGMKARCRTKTHKQYSQYGARGITVCQEWDSFTAFYNDMGPRPTGMSLDRIDNDEGYSKNNCRWATRVEQGRNQTSNVLIEHQGQILPISGWAQKSGISHSTISKRLRMGWPPHLAVSLPLVKRRKGVPWGQRLAMFPAEEEPTDPDLTLIQADEARAAA